MTELLVTGGGGLLGSAVKVLCPDAFFLTSKEGDLRNPEETKRLFETYRPKRVLHLAAEVGGVKRNARENADLFTSNVLINTNVLSAAREFKVERLISILSTCVFQFHPERPSTEEDIQNGLPFAGNFGYAYAKRMLDIHTRLLWEQARCPFSTILPVTMYGPHDNWSLETGHVVAGLIHRSFLAEKKGKPLEVWGTGEAVRQFVYAPDVARILLKLLDSYEDPETLIVAPDSGITIAELARLIARTMDFKGSIVFNREAPEGERIKRVQSLKFSRLFPDFTFTPLEKGLKETLQWFSSHPLETAVGTRA